MAAVLAVVVFAAGACGGSDAPETEGVQGKDIEELSADLVPGELLGLQVTREEISDTLAEARGSYVEGAALFAFRAGDLLQATLQVSRFSEEAKPKSAGFRSAVVNQIGGTRAQQVRVGADNVYLTKGNQQRIAVWFKDDYFYVLSTREDFDKPRGLLREVLQVRT